VTDVARISQYSPRLRKKSERKSISGAQRRRLPRDMLWRPNSKSVLQEASAPPSNAVSA
jgi:hypothetical protein